MNDLYALAEETLFNILGGKLGPKFIPQVPSIRGDNEGNISIIEENKISGFVNNILGIGGGFSIVTAEDLFFKDEDLL